MPSPNLRNKVMLIILDGLGVAPAGKGNAVTLAQPNNLIRYWDSYPHTYLAASGEAVGLPKGVYGNSEVGHLNIGAGKLILQNLPKINKSISTGAYFSNQTLLKVLQHANQNASAIHMIGCLSDGAVHSHIDHFVATHKFFVDKGFKGKLFIHAFTDGRDSPQKSAEGYLNTLDLLLKQSGVGQIASICGRALAMDRNQKWERTEKAYRMLVDGQGSQYKSWQDALQSAYAAGEVDEYIEPRLISSEAVLPSIRENDAVIMMNYRSDRALQISNALISPEFNSFATTRFLNMLFVSMVEYRKGFPHDVIMPKEYLTLPLGRMLGENGLRQLRIAESEKFPHVTYFFNGGMSIKYNGEDRIEIRSPNVPTYDMKPEMSALELLAALVDRIKLNIYDFIVINIANTDMVGHTGNLEACVKAVQVADYCVDQLVKRFTSFGGTVIITADHGNVEEVIKSDGQIDTEHSMNPVPFIVVNRTLAKQQLPYGSLADISPTILHLMGISQPGEMHGRSLLA